MPVVKVCTAPVNPFIDVRNGKPTAELATPFTVDVRLLPLSESALVLTIGTAVPATPLIVVVRLLADDVLATLLTAGAVADTPLTLLVIVLPDVDNALVVAAATAGARFRGVLATPLTVVVKFDPDKDAELVFTSATAAPATPLMIVERLLADETLVILLMMGTAVPATPLIVVVKLLTEELLATLLTIGAVETTPLIVLVIVLTALVRLLRVPLPNTFATVLLLTTPVLPTVTMLSVAAPPAMVLIRAEPFTSSVLVGALVPMPTLPPDKTRILSVPFVFVTKSMASVVPIKLVPATVPVLPAMAHALPADSLLLNVFQSVLLR